MTNTPQHQKTYLRTHAPSEESPVKIQTSQRIYAIWSESSLGILDSQVCKISSWGQRGLIRQVAGWFIVLVWLTFPKVCYSIKYVLFHIRHSLQVRSISACLKMRPQSLFSSPKREVLKMSFCGQTMSVVRVRQAASTINLKAYSSYTPVPLDSKLGRKQWGD